jgi:FSR family fosmidomycin resistance protein-like MFS transporter
MTAATATSFRQDAHVIGLVSTAHGVSHFFQLLLASLFPWLKEAFNVSYAELGLLMTVFYAVSSIGQALAGFLVDRVGARIVLFAGVAGLGLSALVLSLSQNYAMLLAGAVLGGISNCVFHPADLTLLNKRVSTPRLGHAFSVHGISGNLGWAAAPIFLATIAGLAGWRNALLAAALVPFSVLIMLLLNRELLRTEDTHAAVNSAQKTDKGNVNAVSFMRLPSVWMCFGFFLIAALASGGIQSFSLPSLRDLYGMSMAWATIGLTGYMLASAAGTLCGGFVASKAAHHERTIAIAFVSAALMAAVIATGALPVLMAVMLMGAIGFCSGVAGPSRDLLIRAAAPKNATGRVYGVVYSGMDIGLSVGPLLFGALMDAHHPSLIFIFIGVFQVLALCTAIGVGSNTARKAALG